MYYRLENVYRILLKMLIKQEKCHFNKKSVGATCSGYMDIVTGNEDGNLLII
jgi:hypothetical protein